MKRELNELVAQRGFLAVIGMAGKFPGASTPAELWSNLLKGARSICTFTEQELLRSGVDPSILMQSSHVPSGSILGDYDRFDAAFFGYTPREAQIMDPQHRLILECAWEAMEIAGYSNEHQHHLVGVFAGSAFSTYLLNNLYTDPKFVTLVGEIAIATGNDKDALASTISYKLNLKGPSISVQTFCSTSLVAVHLACQSLLTYECDLALAGGVAVQVPQGRGYEYQEGGILSPDGHCRTFDANARGSVMGSGVGLVVLKRLDEALQDGDQIYAVIRGSAVNNDGGIRAGYTAPAVDGQAEVIAEALAHAEVDAETIGYIEAHGTATPLGDAVELAAMIKAFREQTRRIRYCAIGSIKPNVGHLDRAAGVTGLMKVVQALRHKKIPPQIDYEVPNPDVDWENSPFYVSTSLQEWPRGEAPRRAGVSSFGLGGTNAHVVLEEAPEVEESSPARPWELIVLSAKTPAALEQATTRLADHLSDQSDANLGDVAFTLQVGRCAFNHRRIVTCSDAADAASALSARDPQRVFTSEQVRRGRPVAFMFPGLGDQYVGMARELYEVEPTFRSAVDECSAIVQQYLGVDLREILHPAVDATSLASDAGSRIDLRAMLRHETDKLSSQQLKETEIAQPAVFVINYAMAQLLLDWKIQPTAVIGHSLGEYVACTFAGVLSLKDALHVVCKRAQLIGTLPKGAMLAVALSAHEISETLPSGLDLAADNGERATVVAGPIDAITDFEEWLSVKQIACRLMETTHAFHSRMLAPIRADLTKLVGAFSLHCPSIPYISNVTGDWITDRDATDPAYWGRHACSPVLFHEGLRRLLADPEAVILEVGAGQSLSSFAKQHPACTSDRVGMIFSTMRSLHVRQSDEAVLQTSIGRLWLAGVSVDWQNRGAKNRRRRIPLPTYPFERQRHWKDAKPSTSVPPVPVEAASIRKQPDNSKWLYQLDWIDAPLAHGTDDQAGEAVVMFSDNDALVSRLADRLGEAGHEIIHVVLGETFSTIDATRYTIRASASGDYLQLISALSKRGPLPRRFIHAWTLAGQTSDLSQTSARVIDCELERSFYSILFLGQALAKAHMGATVEIVVLTGSIQSVGASKAQSPIFSTILGICRVLQQECAGITCRVVDSGWISTEPVSESLVSSLTEELRSISRIRSVAYRQGRRHAMAFRPFHLCNAPMRPNWREQGVYLITGGLGGIGLTLAGELAKRFRARLALVARTPLPDRDAWTDWLAEHESSDDATSQKIRKLIEIEQIGGEIEILTVDASDEVQLEHSVGRVRSRWGAINGVIHAAGVSDPAYFAPIRDLERRQCETQFRPKIHGLCALHRVTRHDDLDFRIAAY